MRMRIQVLYFIFMLHVSSHSLAQVGGSDFHHFFNNFEDSVFNREWMNPTTITSEISVQNYFSRTDENNHYSSGIEIAIPEDLKHKNFRISTGGLIRVNNTDGGIQMVLSIDVSDSAVFWKGDYLPDSTGKAGIWNPFKVSALLPMSIPANSRVKIFLWNASGKSLADVDDLEINFTEVEFPSFLPK